MIGPEYKAERIKRGLTQSALAALVGVRQATISARERDEIEITKEAELAVKSLPVPKGKGHNAGAQTPGAKEGAIER